MRRILMMAMVFGLLVALTSCMSFTERRLYNKIQEVDRKLQEQENAIRNPELPDSTLVALPSGMMVPSFVLNPPLNPEAYYGVGYAKQSALNLSIKLAETRARADIANQVTTSIEEVVQYYAKDSGVMDKVDLVEYTEIITRGVTEATLIGLVMVNRIPMEDGSVWVLARLDVEKVKESLEATMKKAQGELPPEQTASVSDWRAENAFKYLDEIMSSGRIKSVPVIE